MSEHTLQIDKTYYHNIKV